MKELLKMCQANDGQLIYLPMCIFWFEYLI